MMSVVEADLDNDGGLGEEVYLDALVQWAPPAVSLRNNIGHLQKGFITHNNQEQCACVASFIIHTTIKR